MKTCKACNLSKEPEEFHKDKSKDDGLSRNCKICNRASNKLYRSTASGRKHRKLAKQTAGYKTYKMLGIGGYKQKILKARERNIAFNLTFEEWQLLNAPTRTCHYCDNSAEDYLVLKERVNAHEGPERLVLSFKSLLRTTGFAGTKRLTLDRMDNTKGYTIDNTTTACAFCNQVKGAFMTADEMRRVAKRLYKDLEKALR